ncbi:hypothetical protein LPJ67_000979 [Coemansia sp. RSA 1938]|nr:hypothetical protein LPJ67_000979 [Coemansia sp. RSA 1938]
MVSNAKTVAIPTSVNGLGFKNLEHIDRFNEITEKHLESGEVSGAVPYMSHLFMVQCFLLSGFDNDIKAIELAFKNGAISKTVYDEQISDRKKVHKALREYTTNVLPKDVVDTGADAGLHPDLVRVLSTYSPGFARIGGTINDSIDRHPDDHLWAMLRLNEQKHL